MILLAFVAGCLCGVFATALVVSGKTHDELISNLEGGVIHDTSRNEEEGSGSN